MNQVITRKCFTKGCESHWYETLEGEVTLDNGDLSPVAITSLCGEPKDVIRQTVHACSLECGIKLLEQARENAVVKRVAAAVERAKAEARPPAVTLRVPRRSFAYRLASALGMR